MRSDPAPLLISVNTDADRESAGSLSRATRPRSGTTCVSICNRLLMISASGIWVSPVTFPPGRARLATRPTRTGSSSAVMTIGIVVVAFLAASAAGLLPAKITSTFRRTNSDAKLGNRSTLPSAQRSSTWRFCPSTQPRSRMPFQKASRLCRPPSRVAIPRIPTRGPFASGCAFAASGATSEPRVSQHRNVRGSLLDHLIPPQQHRLRDRQAQRLGGLEIDEQLELGGLLDRQIGRLCTLEDLVNISRSV